LAFRKSSFVFPNGFFLSGTPLRDSGSQKSAIGHKRPLKAIDFVADLINGVPVGLRGIRHRSPVPSM
jgi:hypothetical protein